MQVLSIRQKTKIADTLTNGDSQETSVRNASSRKAGDKVRYRTKYTLRQWRKVNDMTLKEASEKIGEIEPQIKGDYTLANVRDIFPKELAESIELGIKSFDKQIQGFADNDVVFSGVESRTSSPIRILRDEEYTIENTGIYPCGEGAGYAGGIVSAAVDGVKCAEAVLSDET